MTHREPQTAKRQGAPVEAHLRRLLKHTWHAFLARFGRVTKTQARSIEPILDGRSILLSAPTATGKTEAVCAPAIERMVSSGASEATPGVLLVAPTRALCNDLARRLKPPVRRCGLRIDRKTGDSPRLSASAPPHVLVTTPESLDSMLCRRTQTLRSLQTVVFDELHLLDGEARGDQLACLSTRLQKISPGLQRCATSATVARATDMAAMYLGPNAVPIETNHGTRDLDVCYTPSPDLSSVEHALRDLSAADPGAKILAFANRRTDVEWLSAQLGDIGALAHHGSLSRDHRLRVERRFLKKPSGLCVATSTLEVGVDIGDIDKVVLVEPPPGVAAFRQRVGRANRRDERIRATMLYRNSAQRRRFEHMVECVREGRLFGESVSFRPSVAAQQALSLAFQNPAGWVSAEALHSRLPVDARRALSVFDCRGLLDELESRGWLYADSHGRLCPDESGREAFRHGQIHSNLSPDTSVAVVDETTRRTVGRVSNRYLHRPDQALAIGGRQRSVSRIRDARVFVKSGDGVADVEFEPCGAPRMTFEYCQDLARHSGIPERRLLIARLGKGRWRLEHFLGSVWGQVLAGVLEERGVRTHKVGPTTMVLACDPRRDQRELQDAGRLQSDAERAVERRAERIIRQLNPGPYHDFVPQSLASGWLERCVRLDAFAAELSTYRLSTATADDSRS